MKNSFALSEYFALSEFFGIKKKFALFEFALCEGRTKRGIAVPHKL